MTDADSETGVYTPTSPPRAPRSRIPGFAARFSFGTRSLPMGGTVSAPFLSAPAGAVPSSLAEARGIPMLGDAIEDCMAANPNRSNGTDELYCYEATAAERALAQLQPMD